MLFYSYLVYVVLNWRNAAKVHLQTVIILQKSESESISIVTTNFDEHRTPRMKH